MLTYLLRRIFYIIPILLGVNFITFALFFLVNSPDDMARMQLGQKHIRPEAVQDWKRLHGYDLPLFWNSETVGSSKMTHTLFFQKSLKLFTFDFGASDAGRDIISDIKTRMWPSLAIALPSLLCGLAVNIIFSLWLVLFRTTAINTMGMLVCVMLFSISGLFYIIAGQFLFAKVLQWFPISGYGSGLVLWKFLVLPILVSIVAGLGSGTRWYRTIFLEETNKDYVRTARAKGFSEWAVLFRHVLPNALIPIVTGVVVIIPSLFMGSLILESFFGIPGLGSYVIDAIQKQDFAIVRVMVFIGTLLYITGLILTDITYTLIDPRVRLS